MDEISKDYIISIGGSNIDIQGFSSKPILMRESNPGKIRICSGGVGRNIVNNLANIGLKNIKFITYIGNDIFGDILFIRHIRFFFPFTQFHQALAVTDSRG